MGVREFSPSITPRREQCSMDTLKFLLGRNMAGAGAPGQIQALFRPVKAKAMLGGEGTLLFPIKQGAIHFRENIRFSDTERVAKKRGDDGGIPWVHVLLLFFVVPHML